MREFKYYLLNEIRRIKQRVFKPVNLKKAERMILRVQGQKEHAKKQFKERYKMPLTDEDYIELNQQIKDKNSEAEFIVKSGSPGTNSELWKVWFGDMPVYAFFDLDTQQIATFMPSEDIERTIERHKKYNAA